MINLFRYYKSPPFHVLMAFGHGTIVPLVKDKTVDISYKHNSNYFQAIWTHVTNERGSSVHASALNISKAYDCVQHFKLLTALCWYAI